MSYNIFADYYDVLMQNVGYKERSDYICELMKRHNHEFGITLDLACGTGSLTTELALYGTIDTCICTLDSINHITKEEDVTKAFERVAFFMDKDGLFVFDVNTVYKHEQVLANNTFVYETDKVFCVWQNTLRENCVTDIDLDFFEEENGIYYRTSESFSERGYSREKLTEMLVNAGFELEAVYGDMSFDEPKADEQRLVFVARMKNPINKEC